MRATGSAISALTLSVICSTTLAAEPTGLQIDVNRIISQTGARGLAVAVVENGQVAQIEALGERNARGDSLTTDSIMYAASLTKMAFAYTVMQLVQDGLLDLDTSIAEYLPQPLPSYTDPSLEDDYARWSDLADDERWRMLTPRILLNHGSGFANFGFLEPDGKLRFHFDPGTRYAYSGDGLILLQFVLEKGLGLSVGDEMQKRLFDPLQMRDTSMIWRDDFSGRTADGWTISGEVEPHDDRSRVRAAGSMDTTISDMAQLVAAIVRGDLMSAPSRLEFSRPTLAITTPSQFPTLQAEAAQDERIPGLSAALGVVVFDGPQGRGFLKGGHNDSTGNMVVCLEQSKNCVVVLGNDLRAEHAIPWLVESLIGPTGIPWHWEYGAVELWQPR